MSTDETDEYPVFKRTKDEGMRQCKHCTKKIADYNKSGCCPKHCYLEQRSRFKDLRMHVEYPSGPGLPESVVNERIERYKKQADLKLPIEYV